MTFIEAITGDLPVLTRPEIAESYEIAVFNRAENKLRLGAIGFIEDGTRVFVDPEHPRGFRGWDDLRCWDWTQSDNTIAITLWEPKEEEDASSETEEEVKEALHDSIITLSNYLEIRLPTMEPEKIVAIAGAIRELGELYFGVSEISLDHVNAKAAEKYQI